MSDLEKLRTFAQFVLRDWPESVPDEFNIQDKAIDLGLLEAYDVKEPCGENCWCEEYHGEFPLVCYRRTKVLKDQNE